MKNRATMALQIAWLLILASVVSVIPFILVSLDILIIFDYY
jgi:hypothetical protein